MLHCGISLSPVHAHSGNGRALRWASTEGFDVTLRGAMRPSTATTASSRPSIPRSSIRSDLSTEDSAGGSGYRALGASETSDGRRRRREASRRAAGREASDGETADDEGGASDSDSSVEPVPGAGPGGQAQSPSTGARDDSDQLSRARAEEADDDEAVDAAASHGCSAALAAFEAVLATLTAAGCMLVVLSLRHVAVWAVAAPCSALVRLVAGDAGAAQAGVWLETAWVRRWVWSPLASTLDALGVLGLLTWRYSGYFGLHSRDFLRRLGARRVAVSRFARNVMLYHIGGFLVLLALQALSVTEWYFSMENFLVNVPTVLPHSVDAAMADAGGKVRMFDLGRALELIVLSPLREEFVFRVVVFYAAFVRYPSVPIVATVTNALFATVHLTNAYSLRFGALYVVLQVGLGFLVGMFYSMRLAVTGSVWEVVLLHVVNNLTASVVPADGSVDYSELRVLLPLAQTTLVYALCCLASYRQLRSMSQLDFRLKHPLVCRGLDADDELDGKQS